jgi:predicted Zn-dependent peptidase
MLAEMMRHSVLDIGELEKERLVILEEYRRKLDHPQGVLFERLWPELFESGPYHHSVIGEEATIKAIDRAGMLDYYSKRYALGNLALVLAGDFDPASMVEVAEKAFAGFDRSAEAVHDAGPVRYGRGKRIHIDKATGGETYVAFAFPAPGLEKQEAILPLDVAQSVLGSGRASRLYQSLKEKQGLCSGIMTYFPTQRYDSLFVVAATCRPDQVDPLRAALCKELEDFAAEEPTPSAMKRALRLMSSGHLFSMETSGGATSNIGYYYTLTGGTDFLDGYLERLESVTPGQVSQVMRGVLGLDGSGRSLEETMVEISVGQAEKKQGAQDQ